MYQQPNQFTNYFDCNAPNYFQTEPINNTEQNNGGQLEKKLPKSRQRIKANSRILPQAAIDIMTQWYAKHYSNPYPSFRDCEMMANQGQITLNQVKQWFVNVRRRTQNEFRKKRCPYDTKNKRKLSDENNQIYEELNQPKKIKNESFPQSQINAGYNFESYSANIYNQYQLTVDSPIKPTNCNQSSFDSTPQTSNVVDNYAYSNYYNQYTTGYNYCSQSSPSISTSSNNSSNNSMYYQTSPIVPPNYTPSPSISSFHFPQSKFPGYDNSISPNSSLAFYNNENLNLQPSYKHGVEFFNNL